MNGSIVVCCFRELVKARLGDEGWDGVLEASGVPKETELSPLGETPDEVAAEIMHNVCKALGIRLDEAAGMFGEFWISAYASRMYRNFGILPANSKEFIARLNDVHAKAFKASGAGAPPRFRFRWKDADTLMTTFDAGRLDIVFFVGMVKGIGRYFEEDLTVSMWSSDQMLVKFPPAQAPVMALEEREAYQDKA